MDSEKHMSSTCRQINAILSTFKYRYLRNLSEPLKEYAFPAALAIGMVFITRVPEGANLLAIYLPWGYCGFLRQVFVDVTMNKVNKYREYFKINGLSRFSYYTAYLIDGILRSCIISLILLVGFAFSEIEGVHGGNLAWVYLILELNAIASIFIAFTLSVFMEDPFVGSDIVGTMYGLMGFFYFLGISFRSGSFIFSLFPPAAMTLSTLGQADQESSFKIWHGAVYLVGDTILYFLIFFICDTFFGVDKEFTSRYWCRIFRSGRARRLSSVADQHDLAASLAKNPENDGSEMDTSSALYHEPTNIANQIKTVQVENLKKSYGDTPVIRGISISMYEKQIFCLLGHNGAGKTTTISILTGFSRADGGVIKYFGKDFRAQFDEIKNKIGVCPQTDLCLPYMTCEENLRLLAEIRGVPRADVESEIRKQLNRVGLFEDRKKLSSALSGGNRRKLSLAMALMGGTQILYFDEPTSAMDPSSRRMIWDIIKDLRSQGKTIVLTTHYLEEADELADRIGVMSKGTLFAVGSTEFIKKKFGVGYHLYLSPKYGHEFANKFENLKSELIETVTKIIPTATIVHQTSADSLKFCLPFASQSKFAELFRTLEKEEGLQLNLGMNSLEDAFLNISIEEEKKDPEANAIAINEPPASVNMKATYNFWAQLAACFMKRYLVTIRSPQGYYAIIQPIAFIITACLLPGSIQNEAQRLASFCAFLCIGFTANASIYCGSTVYDREKKTKYAMRVMGCKNSAYWLGTFLFDFMIILFFVGFLVLLVYVRDIQYGMKDLGLFVGLSLAFVCANVTVAYFWGFAYKSSLDATSFYPVLALLFFYFVPFVLQALCNWLNLEGLSAVIQVIGFIIGPCLAFQQGVSAMNPTGTHDIIFSGSLFPYPWVYFGILASQAIGYMIITILIENHKSSVKMRSKNLPARKLSEPDDEELPDSLADTEIEINRMNDPDNADVIKVKDLQKVYPTGQAAVKGISFGVEKGQIFGLLGPNGAGKSTTFNMITQLISRSGGQIELNGRSIDSENKFSIYKDCGVCPQFDSLWDLLTVREHLVIFGKIKGLTGRNLQENVDYFLNILHIKQHQNKRSSQLSGGNKRRLCVALASIGAPSMQFMDEPSTGLDPLARVYLWDTIKQTMALRNSSIILTTHSMPEAESLCSKIGIMVNGRFVCIGSTSYLKNKYGSGYKISLARGPDFEGSMAEIIREVSPDAVFLEQDESEIYETYQVSSKNFVFSKAFEILESFKQKGDLSDFSIYHTTLENVFLEFSRYQRQEQEQALTKGRIAPKRRISIQQKLEFEYSMSHSIGSHHDMKTSHKSRPRISLK